MENNAMNNTPTGGFIPIYKKQNYKKHMPTSGMRHKLISISDIMNKKIPELSNKK